MLKFLRRLTWILAYLLPAALFFSYYPVISLGTNSSMNFELSISLITLVLFDLSAFSALVALKLSKSSSAADFPGLSDCRFFLFSLFPFYLTISIFWSANPLRGFLTAGIAWLIFFAVFAIIYVLPLLSPPPHAKRRFFQVFFLSTAAVCIFCFVQSILDTCGLSREHTLLCAGCTYRSFGFPHPSGFAIEPQFMGNLLLAPTLTVLYLLLPTQPSQTPRSSQPSKASKVSSPRPTSASSRSPVARSKSATLALTLLALLFSTTLFFTFSRGAIYAYAIALLILFFFALKRHVFRFSLIVIPVSTFLVSLILQGTFAALGPTSETFTGAVTKSLHQLSLGLLDFRPKSSENAILDAPSASPEALGTASSSEPRKDPTSADSTSVSPLNASEVPNSAIASSNIPQDTYFDGYVPESTNIRLSLNSLAFRTWKHDPLRLLFGVGLGGAGAAMYAAFPSEVGSPKEIVQNEPFSLLLELGLVGIILTIFSLLLAFYPRLFSAKFLDGRVACRRESAVRSPFSPSASSTNAPSASLTVSSSASRAPSSRTQPTLTYPAFAKHPAFPLLVALIFAYFITLNFFSGLPNALQIYLMPPLLYFFFYLND